MITLEEKEEVKKTSPSPTYSFGIQLHSKGKFGYPERVELKPLTLLDLKVLSQASTTPRLYFQKLKEVVQTRLITPVDVNQLTNQDFIHILIGLRVNSIGDLYEIVIRCPECDHKFTKGYKLSEIHAKPISDEAKAEIEIDGYRVRYPRVGDYEKIWDLDNPQDIIMTMVMIALGIDDSQLDNYPAKLVADVSKWLRNMDYGYDVTKTETCPQCGGRVEFQIPFLVDFWF